METSFTSNNGSPQGDSVPAIFYQLPCKILKERTTFNLVTFDYYGRQFLLQQENANDLSFAATIIGDIYRIEEETTIELTGRNLTINREKQNATQLRRGND